MGVTTLGKQMAMVLFGFLLAAAITNKNTTASMSEMIHFPTIPEISIPIKTEKVASRYVNELDLTCMATNIYYEASGQSFAGKVAVGMVVLNRVQNPLFPKTVCGVIYDANENGCQFSWTCSGTDRIVDRNSFDWRTSMKAAQNLLSKEKAALLDITEGALFFHATSVRPDWSNKRKKLVKIDDHIFYK
jgi:spore germination cell wall hydrolase CwlJ-like protein